MNLAILSDIHAEFRQTKATPIDNVFNPFGTLVLPHRRDFENLNVDVFVIAGDIHTNSDIRQWLIDEIRNYYDIPVVTTMGNHDYWGRDFPTPEQDVELIDIDGVKFACCTLWTRLDPALDLLLTRGFSDFRYCHGATIEKWNAVHEAHCEFIRKSGADVVVTHHPPSEKCITSRFVGNPFNRFFVNDLEHLVADCGAKLWISGHVHSKHDFTIGDCRVIVNPLGYPHEFGMTGDVVIAKI